MRVVHVTTNNRGTSMLGYEKYALDLAAEQRACGTDVVIITNRPGALSEACRQRGMPVVVEQSLDHAVGAEPTPALAGQFSSFGADIVNCHTPHAASRAIPVGNLLGVPCVYTVHFVANNGKVDANSSPIVRARSEGMRFATICVSKVNFDGLKKLGIPAAELFYVPSGTMPSPGTRRPEAQGPRRPNLIFVGTLDPRKGTDLAILAMAELRRRRGPGCPVLNIYGSGEMEEHYREIVAVLQMGDIVRFCGFQANVLDWCPDSDILLMSSRSEAGPLVVLEAMSRGMPIVASEVGSVSEMLPDQRYGRIVPVNSIVPLADAVESLLDDIDAGLFDPDLVIERHRSFYTVQKMAERVEAVYKQVLAASSASSER